TSFSVSATLPSKPVRSDGKRAEKSPSLSAVSIVSSCFLKSSPFKATLSARGLIRGIFFIVAFFLKEVWAYYITNGLRERFEKYLSFRPRLFAKLMGRAQESH